MSFNKLTLAQVDWSKEGVPVSREYDDVYFNTENGMQEIEHNFIECNALEARFAQLAVNETFTIAETGFGSGLNFLRCLELWKQVASQSSKLHFISFEKHPMALEDLIQAHQILPVHRSMLIQQAKALQNQYPFTLPGWYDLFFFQGQVRLTLWFGDVQKGLPEIDLTTKVDAWFLDGFAPVKNPDMWQPFLYQHMARLSHEQTTFSTFTAAGDVRRGLAKVGFEVKKRPGFGLKREMCFGRLLQVRESHAKAPWFVRPKAVNEGKPDRAIVIGAGLSGAAVARKLAEKGWQVSVFDAEDEVASQASGNLAGTVHPLITADWNLRSQWYLHGFMASLKSLLPWLKTSETMGDLSGLVELAMNEKVLTRNQHALERVGLPNTLVEPINAEQASQLLGTEVKAEGMFFPQGGWVSPKEVVKKALAHSRINVFCQTEVIALEPVKTALVSSSMWHVQTLQKGELKTHQAPVVVVATGSLNCELNAQLGLPIRPVKGQVTHISESQQRVKLNKALTHSGYAVSYGSGAVTGATFEAPDMSLSLSQESHNHNLQASLDVLPKWLEGDALTLAGEVDGRVAFRPTTPDHLPIIGAIPDFDWMEEAYISQSHTHAVYRYQPQRYQSGLFVSNGHGPRGLMSVFLAAEIIYAELSVESLPLPLSLYQASHPARFKIRQWRSGRS